MSSRDPWLVNAKMALVTLVVVGHSWSLVPESLMRDQVYDFLYAWHMPAFVFVTGYLSRGFTWSRPRLTQTVCTLVVPYLIFEAALAGFRTVVGGETLIDVFVDPTTIWFLVALVLWRLVTPAFRALRGALLVAVVICLLGGLMSPETSVYLDLARVTGFLPFYVLGVKTTPERLEQAPPPGGQDRRRGGDGTCVRDHPLPRHLGVDGLVLLQLLRDARRRHRRSEGAGRPRGVQRTRARPRRRRRWDIRLAHLTRAIEVDVRVRTRAGGAVAAAGAGEGLVEVGSREWISSCSWRHRLCP